MRTIKIKLMNPFCFYEKNILCSVTSKTKLQTFYFVFFLFICWGWGSHSSTAVSKSIDRRSILAKKSPQAQ